MNNPFTIEEDNIIRRMRFAGETIQAIATCLKRSRMSVVARIHRLRIEKQNKIDIKITNNKNTATINKLSRPSWFEEDLSSAMQSRK